MQSHLVLGCVDWNKINIVVYIVNAPSRTSYWGAWIEISTFSSRNGSIHVAPRIGVRGLKSFWHQKGTKNVLSHLVLGCVDWNYPTATAVFSWLRRTSYWGAWIEILKISIVINQDLSHLVLGCVDWNNKSQNHLSWWYCRTSYWGAWIEMGILASISSKKKSRTSYWGAWIEIWARQYNILLTSVAPRIGVRGLK